MSAPLVSVVMSVHNGEAFLDAAVESILGQTFEDFEFVIIDDGSTDRSAEILECHKESDARVQVLHQPNRGLVHALNSGCGMALGKYIARMDADDIAVKDRLMRQFEFMETHPGIGVLGGAVELINASGEIRGQVCNPTTSAAIKSALLEHCVFWHPTVLMRREVFASSGGYRMAAAHAEDYDLWLRIAERSELANLPEVLLQYRIHPNQMSLCKCAQQALGCLAARAAAVFRRAGSEDPLDSVGEISPALLIALGVSEATQQATLAREYLRWIRNMYHAREYSIATDVAFEVLQSSDWKSAESWVLAELRLAAAQAYWRRRNFVGGLLNAVRAVTARPRILGRPLKPFLRTLQNVTRHRAAAL
jgi:glycosyltransferase involved in cell wall biosynthesis